MALSPPISAWTFFRASNIDWLKAMSVIELGMTMATLNTVLGTSVALGAQPATSIAARTINTTIRENLEFIGSPPLRQLDTV
jgi:hypothetical protein